MTHTWRLDIGRGALFTARAPLPSDWPAQLSGQARVYAVTGSQQVLCLGQVDGTDVFLHVRRVFKLGGSNNATVVDVLLDKPEARLPHTAYIDEVVTERHALFDDLAECAQVHDLPYPRFWLQAASLGSWAASQRRMYEGGALHRPMRLLPWAQACTAAFDQFGCTDPGTPHYRASLSAVEAAALANDLMGEKPVLPPLGPIAFVRMLVALGTEIWSMRHTSGIAQLGQVRSPLDVEAIAAAHLTIDPFVAKLDIRDLDLDDDGTYPDERLQNYLLTGGREGGPRLGYVREAWRQFHQRDADTRLALLEWSGEDLIESLLELDEML